MGLGIMVQNDPNRADHSEIIKVVIGLAFGAYFVWWSLQVLDRLTPEYDAPLPPWSAAHHEGHQRAGDYPWLCTLAFEHHKDCTPTHGYDATREAAMTAFREELATEVRHVGFWRYSGNGPVCRPDPVGRKD